MEFVRCTRKQHGAAILDIFNEAIAHSIERVVMTVQRLLSDARTRANEINTIFLTGGSSGIPAFKAALATAVPDARMVEGDAFGSVAAGLALDAERKFGGAR